MCQGHQARHPAGHGQALSAKLFLAMLQVPVRAILGGEVAFTLTCPTYEQPRAKSLERTHLDQRAGKSGKS